ncbi:uncharacterized protein ZK546.14 [Drosophila sulfurigaster albostrigata]|uniref:uncharacterized protein ZK546.14 n=1 Tax=Drosophila sulfurigaster albostrigata TaxID=89887 RepID=UPI002D21B127|nr:uncharacterized protein ZK546.14 [Drosophila sulfurigaster albostrigata]
MSNSITRSLLVLLLASAVLIEAKTVHRRTDKISENFKQLDLPPEEIDPNVAPPDSSAPIADAQDALDTAATPVTSAPAAPAAAVAAVDETLNEIASEDTVPAAAAAAAEATPAETTAVATAKPKPKPTKSPKPQDEDKNPISRYCKCTESHCDCCRKFGLPLLPSGPGCAKIAYLGNDEMSVSLKFGQITLASRRISSKRARPICVSMPGGYNKFCGRVYGLSQAKENFKACLAFELRAEDEVEAQLPISCFKFGAEGLRVAEAEPLPTKVKAPQDEDDDDDIFGFGAGGDDDEDDEDDYDDAEEPSAEDDDAEDYTEDDDTEAPEDADYGGFSLGGLLDELDDDEDEKPAKKPVAAAATPATVADQTREHVETDVMQSKDESGTVAAAADSVVAAEEAAVSAVTAAPAAAAEATGATGTTTTGSKKKSKKAKKNKKKKKAASVASETEGDFAYELLNGILDFFN